jgi:hypothetical protein
VPKFAAANPHCPQFVVARTTASSDSATKIASTLQALPAHCRGEWQLVMCREIPATAVHQVSECCAQHATHATRPRTAAAMLPPKDVPRPDLDAGKYDWHFKKCSTPRVAEVPVFYRSGDRATTVRAGPYWGGAVGHQAAAARLRALMHLAVGRPHACPLTITPTWASAVAAFVYSAQKLIILQA